MREPAAGISGLEPSRLRLLDAYENLHIRSWDANSSAPARWRAVEKQVLLKHLLFNG